MTFIQIIFSRHLELVQMSSRMCHWFWLITNSTAQLIYNSNMPSLAEAIDAQRYWVNESEQVDAERELHILVSQ